MPTARLSYLGRYGPRLLLTCFVGYLGPSAFGLCAAKLIETGRVVAVLWVATILLVLLLFVVRKSFGDRSRGPFSGKEFKIFPLNGPWFHRDGRAGRLNRACLSFPQRLSG